MLPGKMNRHRLCGTIKNQSTLNELCFWSNPTEIIYESNPPWLKIEVMGFSKGLKNPKNMETHFLI